MLVEHSVLEWQNVSIGYNFEWDPEKAEANINEYAGPRPFRG